MDRKKGTIQIQIHCTKSTYRFYDNRYLFFFNCEIPFKKSHINSILNPLSPIPQNRPISFFGQDIVIHHHATPHVRKCLSNGEKLKMLEEVDRRRLAQGNSLRRPKALGVQPIQIQNWRRQRAQLQQVPWKNRSVHRGKESCIKHLEQALIGWCLDQRAVGIPVYYATLQVKAAQLDNSFCSKSRQSQYTSIQKLCRSNEVVVLRCITHQLQRRPQDNVDETLEFLRVEWPIVNAAGVHLDVVINMDQTPVFLSMHSKRSLNLKGEMTVNGRNTCSSKNCVLI